jgi:hypothetical protein
MQYYYPRRCIPVRSMTPAHTTEAHFVIACLEKGRDIPVASEKETQIPLLLSALNSYAAVCLRWYSELPSPCRTKPCGFGRDFHGSVHNEQTY